MTTISGEMNLNKPIYTTSIGKIARLLSAQSHENITRSRLSEILLPRDENTALRHQTRSNSWVAQISGLCGQSLGMETIS
jgi:hypothetical protein